MFQSKRRTLDFILDTVAAPHSLGPTLELLKVNGTLSLVGAPDRPLELPAFPMIFGKLPCLHELFKILGVVKIFT